jgi:hypothetical protein
MHHNMPKTLVRDYVVEVCGEDGRWRSVADVRDNCRRLAVHRFAPVGAVAIRVTVNATYGDFSARIFRIAAW